MHCVAKNLCCSLQHEYDDDRYGAALDSIAEPSDMDQSYYAGIVAGSNANSISQASEEIAEVSYHGHCTSSTHISVQHVRQQSVFVRRVQRLVRFGGHSFAPTCLSSHASSALDCPMAAKLTFRS